MSADNPTPEARAAVARSAEIIYDLAASLAEVKALDLGQPVPLLVPWKDLGVAHRAVWSMLIGSSVDAIVNATEAINRAKESS